MESKNIVAGVGAIIIGLMSVLTASGTVKLLGLPSGLATVLVVTCGFGILVFFYFALTGKTFEEIEEEELRTELLELGVSDKKLQEIRKTYQQIALGALRTQRAAKYQERIRVKTEKILEAERTRRAEERAEVAIREAAGIQEEITEAEKRRDNLRDEARRISQEVTTAESERDEAMAEKNELETETERLQTTIVELKKAKAELEDEKSEL